MWYILGGCTTCPFCCLADSQLQAHGSCQEWRRQYMFSFKPSNLQTRTLSSLTAVTHELGQSRSRICRLRKLLWPVLLFEQKRSARKSRQKTWRELHIVATFFEALADAKGRFWDLTLGVIIGLRLLSSPALETKEKASSPEHWGPGTHVPLCTSTNNG